MQSREAIEAGTALLGGYDCAPMVAPEFDPTLPADEVQIYESPAHEQWEYVRNQLPIERVSVGHSDPLGGTLRNYDLDGAAIADMHKEIERRWARELRWNDAMEQLLRACRDRFESPYFGGEDGDYEKEWGRMVVMITEMLGDGPNMPAKVPAVTNGDRELSGVSG